jgi:hypothetical protein
MFMDIERLYRMHRLIQTESTGTPDDLAERFHIKRRQLFYMKEELELLGAKIKYNPIKQTYLYEDDFNFFEKIGMESLYQRENKKILQIFLKNILEVQ